MPRALAVHLSVWLCVWTTIWREKWTGSCHFAATQSPTRAKMWRCGLSSDRDGLLIGLWKQVTQMTNFPSNHYLEKPSSSVIKKKSFSCSRGRDSLTQAILQASNWAAHPRIDAWFLLWCLSVLLRGCLAVRCFLMKELRTAEAERGSEEITINLAQPDNHLLPKNTSPLNSLSPKTLTAPPL